MFVVPRFSGDAKNLPRFLNTTNAGSDITIYFLQYVYVVPQYVGT
jgi:hypothetical protein